MKEGKKDGAAGARGADDPRAEAARALLDAVYGFMSKKWRPGADPGRHAEFRALRILAADREAGGRGLRVVDLCERLSVKPPTVTRLVDSLVAQGLAERKADPDDRRAARVSIGPAGLELTRELREKALRETLGLVDSLGLEDARKLAALLERSAGYFSELHARGCGKENHPTC